ncbi:putative hydro-lyase [Leuconostoc falkenbergense]|uniref:putative hydro-lyase n=1 Tax=Leuconostoc falkenbergense TaxID=2766470 RepID=UPI002958398E|nr:putative hydro-lyase [Leuconostoc falkenbergense]MDV8951512.1 putative hydro-lyase [Leuconostoc falkenbergense]
MTPTEFRKKVRNNEYQKPTAGMCPGYAQTNLIVLPWEDAYDFLLFAQRNPKPIPILEVTEVGSRELQTLGNDIDVATDFPKYRIYRNGKMVDEYLSVVDFWREDLVSFLIGCSFSFEDLLVDAGIEIRHITEKANVPMFNTNIPLKQAGKFSGNMVVSMRPIKSSQIATAVNVTNRLPGVHGAPIQIGNPAEIGIYDLADPDYGDAVTINENEIPVFWACGVTPQAAVMASKPKFAITHSPGHMLITNISNKDLSV